MSDTTAYWSGVEWRDGRWVGLLLRDGHIRARTTADYETAAEAEAAVDLFLSDPDLWSPSVLRSSRAGRLAGPGLPADDTVWSPLVEFGELKLESVGRYNSCSTALRMASRQIELLAKRTSAAGAGL